MSINDLLKYKQAKIICKDLEEVNKLLTTLLKDLDNYKVYTPVRYLIGDILEQKAMLNIHYKNHKEVLDKKGCIDD